jgi:hypothetical protein
MKPSLYRKHFSFFVQIINPGYKKSLNGMSLADKEFFIMVAESNWFSHFLRRTLAGILMFEVSFVAVHHSVKSDTV